MNRITPTINKANANLLEIHFSDETFKTLSLRINKLIEEKIMLNKILRKHLAVS